MKRLSTISVLVASLATAGAFGVACGKAQQRTSQPTVPSRMLGQSTAMGPSDHTRATEVPQTKAPPIERVPSLSNPPTGPVPANPTTPTSSEQPSPPSPSPTPPHVPNPLPPQAPPLDPGLPPPAPPAGAAPPPSTMPAPSVPPAMMPMQARADAGLPPITPPPPRDAGRVTPRDAAPRADAAAPLPRSDGGGNPPRPTR